MFRKSIKQKIVGIAAGLIVLAVITSLLSMVMASRVGHLLDELTNRYVPAYGDLARANVKSLERSLALRQMIIAKMQTPPDEAAYAAHLKTFQSLEPEIQMEAQAARSLIDAIIADPSTPSNDYELGRLDDRIDTAINDLHRRLSEQDAAVLQPLDAHDFDGARLTLGQVEALRAEFTRKIDAIRSDMLLQVAASANTVIRQQNRAIIISALVTAIAAVLGFVFAMMVGSGITGPVMRLLEGTREVEAGRLDHSISVTTGDEIGLLSAAFNRMIERLRQNQRIREVFGRYVDPRVAEGLLDQTALAAAEGQRRVMTVMFCDMKGFTTLSEGVTPQGPGENHEPLSVDHVGADPCASRRDRQIYRRRHHGLLGRTVHRGCRAGASRLSCRSRHDRRVAKLRKDLPELLGVRAIPADCDIRIGIATGEALVGSIGSEYMMSFTVMGDNVNLASRLEGANKVYDSHCLISEATAKACGDTVELREIDRVVAIGQTHAETIYEVMGRKGELGPSQIELRHRYGEGLAAYRARRWDDAETAFAAARVASPDDGPALALMERIHVFKVNPPAEIWDGAWHLERK